MSLGHMELKVCMGESWLKNLVSSTQKFQLNEAMWHIYASENYAMISSDNGLSPVRHQAIIWSNAGLLSTRPQWTYISVKFKSRYSNFHYRICEFENICKMAAILSQSHIYSTPVLSSLRLLMSWHPNRIGLTMSDLISWNFYLSLSMILNAGMLINPYSIQKKSHKINKGKENPYDFQQTITFHLNIPQC